MNFNSTGTAMQIRVGSDADPASLDDTTELTPATPMKPARTPSRSTTPTPVSNVLVWIIDAGSVNGKSVSDLSEVTLKVRLLSAAVPTPKHVSGRRPVRCLLFWGGDFRGRTAGPQRCRVAVAHVAGDRHAFAELFGRHQRQLYRLAKVTSRDPDDAADALQEAMLSAHRSAPTFRHDASVSSWLYRIVVNCCLDRLRRNKTHADAAAGGRRLP